MPSSEHSSEGTHSRRDILRYGRTIAIATAGAVALKAIESSLPVKAARLLTAPQPELVQRQELSNLYNIPAWTDRNYFPYFHNNGLPSLADDYYGDQPGPLKLHDVAHRIVFPGISGTALDGAKNIANSIPESAASWAGHCGDLAKVNGLDVEPGELVETPLGYIKRWVAIGLLVAARSHTPMEAIPNNPNLIQNLVSQGHSMVLNIPDGSAGNWNRTTTGRFNRSSIEVTNLGGYKSYAYDAIEGAWVFVPRQDSIPQNLASATDSFAIPGVRREVVEFLLPGYLNPYF